jgi:hypothetical protein
MNNKVYLKEISSVVRILDNIEFKRLEHYKLGTANFLNIYEILHNNCSCIDLVKNFILLFLKVYSYDFHCVFNKVLFFASHTNAMRKDHISKIYKLASVIPNSTYLIGKQTNKVLDFNSFLNIRYMPYWWKSIEILDLPFQKKISLLFLVFNNFKWVNELEQNRNIIKTINSLIVLFDTNTFDNILVQYCKCLGVPTATLQHGHFQGKDLSGLDERAGFAYDCCLSDRFFAWGDYSKAEALQSGLSENKIICVGCPTYIGLEDLEHQEIKGVFGVVLDGGGEAANINNKKLIDIANHISKNYNLKYILKNHPGSGTNAYKNYVDDRFLIKVCDRFETVYNFAKQISFALAMGSSVYAELLYMNTTTFRFVPDGSIDLYKRLHQGTFCDEVGLVRLLDEMKTNKEDILKVCSENKAFLFAPGNIAENYRIAIQNLVDRNKTDVRDETR